MYEALSTILDFIAALFPTSWRDWPWFIIFLGLFSFLAFGIFQGFSSLPALAGVASALFGIILKVLLASRIQKTQRG